MSTGVVPQSRRPPASMPRMRIVAPAGVVAKETDAIPLDSELVFRHVPIKADAEAVAGAVRAAHRSPVGGEGRFVEELALWKNSRAKRRSAFPAEYRV